MSLLLGFNINITKTPRFLCKKFNSFDIFCISPSLSINESTRKRALLLLLPLSEVSVWHIILKSDSFKWTNQLIKELKNETITLLPIKAIFVDIVLKCKVNLIRRNIIHK